MKKSILIAFVFTFIVTSSFAGWLPSTNPKDYPNITKGLPNSILNKMDRAIAVYATCQSKEACAVADADYQSALNLLEYAYKHEDEFNRFVKVFFNPGTLDEIKSKLKTMKEGHKNLEGSMNKNLMDEINGLRKELE